MHDILAGLLAEKKKNMFKKKNRIIRKDLIRRFPLDSIILIRQLRSEDDRYVHLYQDSLPPIRRLLKGMEHNGGSEGVFRCGYDYELSIFDSGKHPLVLKVCFACSRVYIHNIGFQIEKEQIVDLFKTHCKVLKIEEKKFEDLASGQEYYANELNKNSLVGDSRFVPNWYTFEGFFLLSWKDKDPSLLNIVNKIRSRIRTEYPEEEFEVRLNSPDFNSGQFYFYIDCNKSLYSKMNWAEKQKLWTKHVDFRSTVYLRN